MYHPSRSIRGFTLVEIMIVVVIIGLLAALAIPGFQKVNQKSRRAALVNDARQIAAAAKQYFIENNTSEVQVVLTDGGLVSQPLSFFVRQLGRGYGDRTINMTCDGSFTLSHPAVLGGANADGPPGGPVPFNAEGQLYYQ